MKNYIIEIIEFNGNPVDNKVVHRNGPVPLKAAIRRGQIYIHIWGRKKHLARLMPEDPNDLSEPGSMGCGYGCGDHPESGFIAEDGCPVHDLKPIGKGLR